MQIAVNLGPTANWTSVLAAAKKLTTTALIQ